MKCLVTGAAGFIGYHASARLLQEGHEVVGLDNLNPYYDPQLKRARLARLHVLPGFRFVHLDLVDRDGMADLFRTERFTDVLHLAAQAGVRYSVENPHAYVESNVVGFLNVLEGCRHNDVGHLIYASTSSVFGANTKMPLSVHDGADHPVSLYAATKKANEVMAHSYSHLFRLPTTGVRFFTVYGPWGRPDMALFSFTKAMLEGKPIQVFNYGRVRRDFTYIDDAIEALIRLLPRAARSNPEWSGETPDPATSLAPYRLYNIGNSCPVGIMEYIEALEAALGRTAEKELVPMQPGDVVETFADGEDLVRDVGFRPNTPVREGVRRFVSWYKEYYQAG